MTIKELVEQEIRNGLSRRELARKVHVSLGTVQNILLGDTEIKNSTLDKFSRYFNVKPKHGVFISRPLPLSSSETDLLRKYSSCLEDLLRANKEIGDLREQINKLTASVPEESKKKKKVSAGILPVSADKVAGGSG